MPLPANPSQRMSDTDTVLHRLKFLLFAIFSGVLATVPAVMAHAEGQCVDEYQCLGYVAARRPERKLCCHAAGGA